MLVRKLEGYWETRTIATGHTALHDDDLLALPCTKDGHAGDGGAGFEGDGIHGVVCADDEGYVCFGEVVVDFVHF